MCDHPETESRFFLVKSFNETNVRHCMDEGVWTTQTQNGDMLTEAFERCRHVILFFSINKSRGFQGYCRMASPPSPDTPRPTWMDNIHWETSAPFRVEWLNTATTGFSYVHHLKNSLNEDLSVVVGKDGQEIEEECARGLMREMDSTADAESDRDRRERAAREWKEAAAAGGGEYHGGHSGGYVRRGMGRGGMRGRGGGGTAGRGETWVKSEPLS